MKRTVYLEPAATVLQTGCDVDPNGSPYGGSPLMTAHAALKDAGDAGVDFGSYLWVWPDPASGGNGSIAVSVDRPPYGICSKLVIHAWWDFSGAGGNQFYYGPAPQLRLMMRNRAASGYLYNAYDEVGDGNFYNINQPNGGTGYSGPRHWAWSMTTHPEGGSILSTDLAALVVGANFGHWNAPSHADQPFPKIRLARLRVEVEVDDAGASIEGPVSAAATALRLKRSARNRVALAIPARVASHDVGDTVYVAHPKGPGVDTDGWGEARLERRPVRILQRTVHPEELRLEDSAFDLHDVNALAVAHFRIRGAWTPDLLGMAYRDQGGGWEVTRAQNAWSPRSGDGVSMAVLEGKPNISDEGLAIFGGGDTVIFWGGVAWTTSVTGAVTITSETEHTLIDSDGYRWGYRLAFGSAGGTCSVSHYVGALSISSTGLIHVRIRALNVAVPAGQQLEYRLVRTGNRSGVPYTEYWDETNRTWSATAVNNLIPSLGAYSEIILENVPRTMPAGSDASPLYTHYIGRWSSNLADCEFVVLLDDFQVGGTTGNSYGARTPGGTSSGTPVSRVADVYKIDNTYREVWPLGRSQQVVEFRPCFVASALPDATTKPILYAEHAGGGYDVLEILRSSGVTSLRLRRKDATAGTEVSVSVPITTAIQRDYVLRVWSRVLDAEAWRGFAPYSIAVGFGVFTLAGALVEEDWATAPGQTAVASGRGAIYLGSDPTPTLSIDSWIRHLELRRNPLSHAECLWRR